METSQQQDERIQRQADLIVKELKRATNRAYLCGAIVDLLVGLGLGIAIGYDMGSPTTVVIPLEPGTAV